MSPNIEITREEEGFALCHNTDNDKYTVVKISHQKGQVYSAMPTDGSWFARISDSGINYVAGWYSRDYARRIFRERVAEARELREW